MPDCETSVVRRLVTLLLASDRSKHSTFREKKKWHLEVINNTIGSGDGLPNNKTSNETGLPRRKNCTSDFCGLDMRPCGDPCEDDKDARKPFLHHECITVNWKTSVIFTFFSPLLKPQVNFFFIFLTVSASESFWILIPQGSAQIKFCIYHPQKHAARSALCPDDSTATRGDRNASPALVSISWRNRKEVSDGNSERHLANLFAAQSQHQPCPQPLALSLSLLLQSPLSFAFPLLHPGALPSSLPALPCIGSSLHELIYPLASFYFLFVVFITQLVPPGSSPMKQERNLTT